MRKSSAILSSTAIKLWLCFFCGFVTIIACGCAKPGQQSLETLSRSQATPPPAPTNNMEKEIVASPPQPVAVQAAIARVFEGTVSADPARFIVGDFDGDGSQDLVAVVMPVKGMLSNLNSEFARWKIEDPRKIPVLRSIKDFKQHPQAPAPVQADQNDLLLALIHGHGPYGWRNPDATNAYLMKNAVGRNITQASLKEALAATNGRRNLLTLRGDIIKETLGKESGFIFWTGADYAWQSLEMGKAIDPRMVARVSAQ